jgi:hypothetical protein
MTEGEMWERLAAQLDAAVAARPEAKEESLAGIMDEVEDSEFLWLLAASLGLDKHDDVANVMRHPHYPGKDLVCDRYWCDQPAGQPCPLEKNGRCSHFPEPS